MQQLFSFQWTALCRRWLLAPECLQETHAQDYAKGLSQEHVHQVKAFVVQCECPWPASLPYCTSPAEPLRTILLVPQTLRTLPRVRRTMYADGAARR